MVHAALFSSKSAEWETPPALFDPLHAVFDFGRDVCATDQNHQVAPYYSIAEDGLAQDWDDRSIWYWMNPPYGDAEQPCKPTCTKKRCRERGAHTDLYIPGIADWMTKAYQEHVAHNSSIVSLLPARTDTRYYHSAVRYAQYTVYLEGRFKFLNPYMDDKNGATFPSILAIYTTCGLTPDQLDCLESLGEIRVPLRRTA